MIEGEHCFRAACPRGAVPEVHPAGHVRARLGTTVPLRVLLAASPPTRAVHDFAVDTTGSAALYHHPTLFSWDPELWAHLLSEKKTPGVREPSGFQPARRTLWKPNEEPLVDANSAARLSPPWENKSPPRVPCTLHGRVCLQESPCCCYPQTAPEE